jgi:hypothetical protein
MIISASLRIVGARKKCPWKMSPVKMSPGKKYSEFFYRIHFFLQSELSRPPSGLAAGLILVTETYFGTWNGAMLSKLLNNAFSVS